MNGLSRSIDYIQNEINNAKDTKQAIINCANSYEYIKKKIKELEKNTVEEMKNQKFENLDFDPNEIEPIVLKRKERGER